jgi:hypothetical protein
MAALDVPSACHEHVGARPAEVSTVALELGKAR